jgi:TetR/AcrR family transcriptional regulator
MASSTPPKKASTAERILDAAEALFASRGYDGTSLGHVADRVGIRGPSLYNHFKNKRELYTAVLARLLDPFFELLDDLVARPATASRAKASLEIMLRHHVDHPNLARLIQHAALAEGDQLELLIERWYRPFFDRVGKLFPEFTSAKGEDAEHTRAVIIGFNNMILGYVTLAPLHSKLLDTDLSEGRAVASYLRFLEQRELTG